MKFRSALAIALCGLMVLGLAGCGEQKQADDSTAKALQQAEATAKAREQQRTNLPPPSNRR